MNMAEKTQDKKTEKQPKQDRKSESFAKAEKKATRPAEEETNEMLIRITGYDIPGSKNLISGLTRIKGVSWAV